MTDRGKGWGEGGGRGGWVGGEGGRERDRRQHTTGQRIDHSNGSQLNGTGAQPTLPTIVNTTVEQGQQIHSYLPTTTPQVHTTIILHRIATLTLTLTLIYL